MRFYMYGMLFLAPLILNAQLAKSATISIPPNGGAISFGPSGGSIIAYGQVLTVPTNDTIFSDYSFIGGGTGVPFVSQVYLWNGSTISGSALYTSPTQIPGAGYSSETFYPQITVAPGAQYIAMVSNEPYGVSIGGGAFDWLETANASVYQGGSLVGTLQNPSSSTSRWSGQSQEVAFSADLSSSVPEPSSAALIAIPATFALARRLRLQNKPEKGTSPDISDKR